jgi:nucleotide-binding universal stress UspA family protein
MTFEETIKMLPIRTILHPTDFSGPADSSYRVARMIARECGARLVVLHVAGMDVDVSPVVYTEFGFPFALPEDYQTYHAALRGQLQERFGNDAGDRVETRLVDGDAAEEILRVAEEVRCDLIAMGTEGRGGLGRLLLGSVAETVLRKARCPVLTVKSAAANRPAAPEGRGSEASTAVAEPASIDR